MPADLFLDKLKLNQNAQVMIGLPTKKIIAYLSQDISMGGTTTWESNGDAFGDVGKFMNDASKALNQFVNFAGAARQGKIETIRQTLSNYTGSSKLSLSLNLTFIAYRADMDIRQDMGDLLACSYPLAVEGAGITGTVAPLGYIPFNGDTMISLTIGKWFRAPPIFLAKSCNITFSKEVTSKNTPLFGSAQLVLEAFRLYEAKKILELIYVSR